MIDHAARILGVVVAAIGGCGLYVSAAVAADAAPRPNIIFILADDIGYGDFGCYGATTIKTPHVDRLAREGVRCTDAHAPAAVCTPTRYAFLTGQYAWRNPAGSHILSGEAPLSIHTAAVTVPSLLKHSGYTTALVGKWHLGLGRGELDFNRPIRPGPRDVGFDYAFFFPATGDRVPCVYVENDRVVGLDPADPIRVSYAGKIGDEPTGREHPGLLKMKPSHGHADTIVNGISRIGFMAGGKSARWNDEHMADTLTGKAVAFIEQNRARPFFLYFATQDIHVPRVPHQRFQGTSGCGVRGDVVREFDGSVGAVLAALDRLKLADRTLVIVTSDNGGVMDDGYADGAVQDAHGHRCNGPLRGYKGNLWEGGHREPFVARWPGRIKPGSTSNELICLVDMLATMAAVVDAPLPQDAGPDSFNVLSALVGEKHDRPARDHLVMQTNGESQLAIRKGPWKLIPGRKAANRKSDGSGGAQLYNLADDPGETTNVALKHPEIVRELTVLLQEIRSKGRSRP